MQAFTLTFFRRSSVSDWLILISIGFLAEFCYRNNEKQEKDSEVAEEMKRGHLVSMSFRVIWKSKCHFAAIVYINIYLYISIVTFLLSENIMTLNDFDLMTH